MLKSTIVTCLLFVSCGALAQNQLIVIDKAELKNRLERRDQAFVLTVSGRAINVNKEAGGQLSLYVRTCGFIVLPKNSKAEAPKENQRVTATLKERCKIDDWK